MAYYLIAAALLVALAFTYVFSSFRHKGPYRGLLLFFLVIFLTTWSAQLWIIPFGPVLWGIAWVPLFIVALFFAFLMMALTSPAIPAKEESKEEEEKSSASVGLFFWIVLSILLVSIILGYYK